MNLTVRKILISPVSKHSNNPMIKQMRKGLKNCNYTRLLLVNNTTHSTLSTVKKKIKQTNRRNKYISTINKI